MNKLTGQNSLQSTNNGTTVQENTQLKKTDTASRQGFTGDVRISVRGLTEFILRHGDIDNRRGGSPDTAMSEGSRIHRLIQSRQGPDYEAEVPLTLVIPTDNYCLSIEGRADGIITTGMGVTIDEIKGTYRKLEKIKEPLPEHLAQVMCYAYIYALQKQLESISVRLTYCNIETEDIRYFNQDFLFAQLSEWFTNLVNEYRKWADFQWEWNRTRQDSIPGVEFPFPYREGQRELAVQAYQTIYEGKKLFLEAPTGVGKTITTIFPSIKAMGKGLGERIFYLTAKTITRTVAENAIELLRGEGLRFRSITLTAKEKICFQEKAECNPENCEYAHGHYDRINEALFDLVTSEERLTREKIEEYARKHRVCPFELQLDASLFSDGIIGDYNYLFDPKAKLKRFFAEGVEGDNLFLVDETHNLVERGREMYSAQLIKEDLMDLSRGLKKEILDDPKGSLLVSKGFAEKMIHRLEACNREFLNLKRECPDQKILPSVDKLVLALERFYGVVSDYLEEHEEGKPQIREDLMERYFEVAFFLETAELLDDNYVIYSQVQDDRSFLVRLFCVNPRERLKECMDKGRASILFSATLLPIQYYKFLLGGEEKDYEVYAKTVFDPSQQGLFVADDVTSKYTRRTSDEFRRIADYISRITSRRNGNYLVFCPSHAFLEEVYAAYMAEFCKEEQECLLQPDVMNEAEREEFLARFDTEASSGSSDLFSDVIRMDVEEEEGSRSIIGFCVLGGIFSEGIDLTHDRLIGVIVVGTGLPQVCFERELLRSYFDDRDMDGFDYAYRFPGMNKVLQAAGRVIRTTDDIGIIALLDERFLQTSYQRLFPCEWERYQTTSLQNVSRQVSSFWNDHLL
jgi:Rad3-related DNA helicase